MPVLTARVDSWADGVGRLSTLAVGVRVAVAQQPTTHLLPGMSEISLVVA